jgi:parallel beta-helix repeat protein
MIKRISALLITLFSLTYVQAQQKPVSLKNGMKITSSKKIIKTVYKIDGTLAGTGAVIIIEGNNIVVDFNNAELSGSNKINTPDGFFGTAVLIRNSKNITIKNLKARGYKVALRAQDVDQLTVENCDFSYNYRQRLNSTPEKEDMSDWMSYHQNEKDEWLRYGAAIYLRNCNRATIQNCKVTGGQNALMIAGCSNGMIINNDFSFNSGIGIGMYRSSKNYVCYNRLIFNVRGYSHGVYNRGQDSAGILVYEQSSNNLFYRNNVTHGGDGFFLWAGQTTMDSGEGGCNDNIIMKNDFSYAPTNGIEVTFSRNIIDDNRIFECDHGIWGGYSYNTTISNNKFRNNRVGVAIEHGQDNNISFNLFFRDKEAIRLWARKEQPTDWGYAARRDTRSHNYSIVGNNFSDNPLAFYIRQTDTLNISGNTFSDNSEVYDVDSTVTGLDTTYNGELIEKLSQDVSVTIPGVKEPNDPFRGAGVFAGRKNIMMTEWGPYDFRSPVIWHTNPSDSSDLLTFDLLGPKGKWKIKNSRGVQEFSATEGDLPAKITARKKEAAGTDIRIELEYTGTELISPFGIRTAAGRPYLFSFKKFFQPIDWTIDFFAMDTASYNPIGTGDLFAPNVKVAAVKHDTSAELNYAWWGGLKADQVYKQFITTATGKANIPAGKYELLVTWDDAVRVHVNNKLVLDEWNPGKYSFDQPPMKRIPLEIMGETSFYVEHLELGGFATLSLKLLKL